MPTPETVEAPAPDPLGELVAKQSALADERRPQPLDPNRFLGAPVAALEGQIGPPNFIRREGANEFRRYRAPSCQLYAVVAPAGGRVTTLSAGPLTLGEPGPDLSVCLTSARKDGAAGV